MARTISQLDIGSTVVLLENGEDVEYILKRKDSYGCELLRKEAYIAKRMHSSSVSVYEGCEMDLWCENTETGFLSLFNQATLSALSSRSVSTYTYGDTECHYIPRKCYLASYGEMFLSTPTALEPDTNTVTSLMLNKNTLNADTARVAVNSSNSTVNWWLRSPNSAAYFWSVSYNGGAFNVNATNASYWARLVLNVASNTRVSDEGAETIYLLPETRPREVEFKAKVGVLDHRPINGVVKVTTHNLNNIVLKVTNNYGDANPIWQTVSNDTMFEFTNTIKETSEWELGIWCSAQAADLNKGYFEEPVIIVEV